MMKRAEAAMVKYEEEFHQLYDWMEWMYGSTQPAYDRNVQNILEWAEKNNNKDES
jgi:hypothetical protein